MGFARVAGVPVILAGDIARGGVIASLVGTHAVLDAADRAMIRGYLINKFRGDVRLFDAGLAEISRRTGWMGLGVVPWLAAARRLQIGRAHVCTPVTNAHLVCRHPLDKKN